MSSHDVTIIVGIVMTSLTVVFGALLGFARWLLKHEEEPDDDVWIEPFVYPSTTLPCPKCGVSAGGVSAGEDKESTWGPGIPKACQDGDACPAAPRDHLHVACGYCGAKWYRAPKIAVKT